MEKWTLGYGGVLTALGVGGFLATGARHKTALIPAGFGVAALGLGLLARKRPWRRGARVGAEVLGVLGVLGSARGLARLPALLRGQQVERPPAVIAQALMAGLSATYVVLGLRELSAGQ